MKKNKFITILIAAWLAVVVYSPVTAQNDYARKTFDEALDIHLNAIRGSNLKQLEPTVSDSIVHITPMGDKSQSKVKFMKVHEDWFKRNNWEWEGGIYHKSSSNTLGYALIEYTYLEKDAAGNLAFKIRCYLTLIFKKSDKGWQLVFDQNTMIPDKTSKEREK
jgi:ketosteroid isomerase-like protein